MLYDPHGFTLNLTPVFVRLWERGPQAEAEAQGRPIMQMYEVKLPERSMIVMR